MTHYPIELTNVIYNPANQAFEARALVHDPAGMRSYACAVSAPISTDFERAAERLSAQAHMRHLSALRGRDSNTDLPQAAFADQQRKPRSQVMERLYELLRAA